MALSGGDLCCVQNTTSVGPSQAMQVGSTIDHNKQKLLAHEKNMQCDKKTQNLLF